MEDERVTGRTGESSGGSSDALPDRLRSQLETVWRFRQRIIEKRWSRAWNHTIYDRVYQICSGAGPGDYYGPNRQVTENEQKYKNKFAEIDHSMMRDRYPHSGSGENNIYGGFVHYIARKGYAYSRIYVNANPQFISQVMKAIAHWIHPPPAPPVPPRHPPPPTRYAAVVPPVRVPPPLPPRPPLPVLKDVVQEVKFADQREAFTGRHDMIVIYFSDDITVARRFAAQLAQRLNPAWLRNGQSAFNQYSAPGISVAPEDTVRQKDEDGLSHSFTESRSRPITEALVLCLTGIAKTDDVIFADATEQDKKGYWPRITRNAQFEDFVAYVRLAFAKKGISIDRPWDYIGS